MWEKQKSLFLSSSIIFTLHHFLPNQMVSLDFLLFLFQSSRYGCRYTYIVFQFWSLSLLRVWWWEKELDVWFIWGRVCDEEGFGGTCGGNDSFAKTIAAVQNQNHPGQSPWFSLSLSLSLSLSHTLLGISES